MKRIRSIIILIGLAVIGVIGVTSVAAQAQRSQQLTASSRHGCAVRRFGRYDYSPISSQV
jgi:hypothetical protein